MAEISLTYHLDKQENQERTKDNILLKSLFEKVREQKLRSFSQVRRKDESMNAEILVDH